MSKLETVRFCDKCHKNIPTGDVYYETGNKKELCGECRSKLAKKRTKVSFRNLCVGATLAALACVGTYERYDDLDSRVDNNTKSIVLVAEYTIDLEARLKQSFSQMSIWAETVENRINTLYRGSKEEARLLEATLTSIQKQADAITASQKKLITDLTTGKMTNEKVTTALAVLQMQQKEAEQKLRTILRNPQEIINKVIKPTVTIAVKSRDDTQARGTGVLFKREKIVDPKTKVVTYRYYGFTCYHVWQGVFKYLDDIKKPDSSAVHLPDGRIVTPPKLDKERNPELVLYYFNGNSKFQLSTIAAKFIHPTAYMKEFRPSLDFAVFTFDSNDGSIAIAELASDAEYKNNIHYGTRVYSTGIAMGNVPSLYFGTIANPALPGENGLSVQTYAYYGQSGGPIYDAETLKVISINQRLHVHPGMLAGTPVTNLLFGTSIVELRSAWEHTAPKQYKKLLD